MTENELKNTLGFMTRIAHQALSDNFRKLCLEEGIDLPQAQGVIMALLYLREGISQQEVSNLIGKDKSAVKRSVDNLIKRGLIVKSQGSEKSVPLMLTEKAKALNAQIFAVSQKNQQVATQGLTPEEVETCRKVLRTIVSNLS